MRRLSRVSDFLYILWPGALGWASVPVPAWLRWTGACLGVVALACFAWVHHTLGANFSARLRIRDRQALVTSGPYRLARHPMYTAFYLLHLGVCFLVANWFIAATWMLGLTVVIWLRVRREEAILSHTFGAEYESYAGRTGMFFPRINVVPAALLRPGEREASRDSTGEDPAP